MRGMRIHKYAVIFFMGISVTYGGPLGPQGWENLLNAIHQVESSGRLNPPDGDEGQAIGPFQIHYAYWKDSGIRGSYQDCRKYEYAKKVVRSYLTRYGQKFVKQSDYQSLMRIHNGGPSGYRLIQTRGYWKKGKKLLKFK